MGTSGVIFQTDHDQLLIGSLPPVEQAMGRRTPSILENQIST
jgi:hypothetical protein